MASQSKVLAQVRPDGLEDAPQLQIDIDRDKASALGVGFDAINSTLSTALGSSYVNDFPNQGRLQRVVVQADAPARMQPDDLLKLNASNNPRQAVPLSAFASTKLDQGCPCKPCATTAIRPCASRAAPPRATALARPWPKWSAGRPTAGRLWLRVDRPVARRKTGAGSQALILYASRSWRCSCAWRRCTKAGPFRWR
jgi:multidrug efflux pump